ncbi:MAG TPA: hypothetical protein VIG33_02660, partial [Pseudobdellovibrionaceae bacterium]
NNSSERILKILQDKAPTLAPYFKDFRDLVFNTDYSKTKVWESTPFGLVELDDQNITSLIPENCKKEGKTQLIQAVIREFQSFSGADIGHIIYKFDPKIVDSLDKKSPLQLSFLMVHEWLWDLSQNVDRNRRINRFLHSREIESMSSEKVIKTLQGMGLTIPDVQADLFDDQVCQGTPMTAQDLDTHYPGAYVLASWGQISIQQRQRVLNCPAPLKNCDTAWKDMVNSNLLFQDNYKYFLSPTWVDNNRKFPLKIISPQYMNHIGQSVRYDRGQFACRFTEDPKQNIECKIIDPIFYSPLFGSSPEPFQEMPLLKGILTTECFRLKATGNTKIEIFGNVQSGEGQVRETETVFYLRAKDGVFLKPH